MLLTTCCVRLVCYTYNPFSEEYELRASGFLVTTWLTRTTQSSIWDLDETIEGQGTAKMKGSLTSGALTLSELSPHMRQLSLCFSTSLSPESLYITAFCS